jgi:hypothetical protein
VSVAAVEKRPNWDALDDAIVIVEAVPRAGTGTGARAGAGALPRAGAGALLFVVQEALAEAVGASDIEGEVEVEVQAESYIWSEALRRRDSNRSMSSGFSMIKSAPQAVNRSFSSGCTLPVIPIISPWYPPSRIFCVAVGPSMVGIM